MKKFLSLLTIIILVASVGLLTGCGPEIVGTKLSESQDMSGTVAGKLTLNGSTSMTRVCQALGEAFSEKYPGVSVEKSGTGSGDAPNSVRSGIALIGDMSRDLKESENPDEFEIKQIAIDGIAIAVHKDNPVQDLTTEQIRKIFTGEIKNWSELGGQDKAITTLGREAASGTRDGFESIFSIESPVYAAELSSTGEIVTKISSDISAIGYVSLESLNDSVVACKVDGVEATDENIENGTYTVQRPFIQIYKKGTDSALINAWFEFIESSEGQQIIKDVGLIGTANKNG